MLKNYKNKIFVVFILISIICSFYFIMGRVKAEKSYKNYEVCADYSDFSRMAYSENMNVSDYFKKLTENGVTTVTFNEATINSMKKDPYKNLKTHLDGLDLVVEGNRKDLDLIKNGLESLKDKREIRDISDEKIIISGRPSDVVYYKSEALDVLGNRVGDDGVRGSILEYIGLGFDVDAINSLSSIPGIHINLRPLYLPRYQDVRFTMNRFFDAYDKYAKNQDYIVFAGKSAYKNTKEDNKVQSDFINNLTKRNLAIGLIEAANQRGHLKLDGIDPIAKDPEVGKLRVFSTWDYIQTEYDYLIPGHHNGEELTNVYYRAVSERNIASIFLRPFIKNDEMLSNPSIYGKVIGDLQTRLAKKGYEEGTAHAIGMWNVNNKMKLPIALGTTAAGVILLSNVFNISALSQIIIFILGALLSFIFFVLGRKEDLGSVLFNLAAIVTYPSLAICFVMGSFNKVRKSKDNKGFGSIYVYGFVTLIISILISLIGSLMEVSYMSGTNYLVELNIFRGVKISQLLPILLSMFIYASYVGFGRKDLNRRGLNMKELNSVMNESVKFWQAALVGLVLIILALFIIRGGNTSAKVPGIELLFRNMMEKYLPARPRTKSLFIGYPAVFLLIYLGYKNRGKFMYLLLTLFVAIGQADIVNTFSHIRTPLYMSFARVIIEVAGAAVLGFILIAVVEFIMKGYDKYIEKKL